MIRGIPIPEKHYESIDMNAFRGTGCATVGCGGPGASDHYWDYLSLEDYANWIKKCADGVHSGRLDSC